MTFEKHVGAVEIELSIEDLQVMSGNPRLTADLILANLDSHTRTFMGWNVPRDGAHTRSWIVSTWAHVKCRLGQYGPTLTLEGADLDHLVRHCRDLGVHHDGDAS